MRPHYAAAGMNLALSLTSSLVEAKDYADFNLRPGFANLHSSGETGGHIDAQQRYGKRCPGFTPNPQIQWRRNRV